MIREGILDWFSNNGNMDRNGLMERLSDNFLDAGIIDSFGFIRLISFCEKEYGVTFSEQDFRDSALFTLSGIISLIENKTSIGNSKP